VTNSVALCQNLVSAFSSFWKNRKKRSFLFFRTEEIDEDAEFSELRFTICFLGIKLRNKKRTRKKTIKK
jgi:hypothetical protein